MKCLIKNTRLFYFTSFKMKSLTTHTNKKIPHKFLTACIRSKENLSVPAITQKYLLYTLSPSFRWLSSETKRWNLGLPLCPPPLNKTGDLLPCHLYSPIFPALPPHYLPTSPTVPPHYSSNFPTLPPHSSHTRFLPSQLMALPPFPPHLSPMTNKSLQNSNVLSLGREGKHVWLTVRQPLMKAGWWDPLLALQDLAETISINYY